MFIDIFITLLVYIVFCCIVFLLDYMHAFVDIYIKNRQDDNKAHWLAATYSPYTVVRLHRAHTAQYLTSTVCSHFNSFSIGLNDLKHNSVAWWKVNSDCIMFYKDSWWILMSFLQIMLPQTINMFCIDLYIWRESKIHLSCCS